MHFLVLFYEIRFKNTILSWFFSAYFLRFSRVSIYFLWEDYHFVPPPQDIKNFLNKIRFFIENCLDLNLLLINKPLPHKKNRKKSLFSLISTYLRLIKKGHMVDRSNTFYTFHEIDHSDPLNNRVDLKVWENSIYSLISTILTW